jgi:nitronate monooxygenase
VELTATVSNLGGVGGFGAYTLEPSAIAQVNEALRKATDKPYNMNLWVSDTDVPGDTAAEAAMQKARVLYRPYFDELGLEMPVQALSFSSRFENQVQVILDYKPAVFSFLFGIPSARVLEECRRAGIVTMGAATTLDEALALEAAGVDAIVASGFEAGGHRPSFLAPAEKSLTGTFVLVQLIRERVHVPVIAAGGIATGKGIAAALALGADGVQVGTAFLACEESGAPAFHRDALFSEAAKYSVLTRAFTGRLGRGLRNRISEEVSGKEESILPFPLHSQFISPLRQQAVAQKKWEMILLWGGQIAPLLRYRKAAELMHALIEETSTYFEGITYPASL